MKICLINNLFPPYDRGGAEAVVATYAEALTAAGYKVVVITTAPDPAGSVETGRITVYRLGGFNSSYHRLGRWPKLLRPFWHLANLFDFGAYGKIKKILEAERINLVWTHNLLGLGMLVPLLATRFRLKHYHTLHDVQLLHPSGLVFWGREGALATPWAKLYQALCRALWGSPSLVTSPSRWLLEEHKKRGFFAAADTLVLSNPAPKVFSDKATHSRPPKFRLLFVGQLERHKGADLLVDIFRRINTGKAELLLVGGGALRGRLGRLTDQDYNIKILGRRSHDQVLELMRTADCLVVPSLCYENSPAVVSEAIASGLPVLASAIGGIPELLKGAPGLLFRPADAAELEQKLRWAIDRPEELQKQFSRIELQPAVIEDNLRLLGLG